MKHLFLILILVSSFPLFSQRGKDGVGNIAATTTVNLYTSLTTNANAGSNTISVASVAGYTVGDLIYIIQMQGATPNCYINIFGNPNSPEPIGPNFGRITNYNNAGNNEYAQIASISGNTITIDCSLTYSYTATGKVQVLRVPRYSALTITNAGTITCPPWNGTIGGVIAIEVDGITNINANGRIDASGLGFRGGIVTGKLTGLLGGGAWGHNNPNEGAYKGESIAGDVLTYSVAFQGLYCKGAIANGGGGGNGNNAGGGGGANGGDTSLYTGSGNPDISVGSYTTAWNLEAAGMSTTTSSGGGRGGYTFSNASASPLVLAPTAGGWAGDTRRIQGGQGGRPLNYNTGRLYLGGGAGAGDENDAFGGAGGNGGGIINIVSYGPMNGGGQIISNGQSGFNTTTPNLIGNVSGRDGAGGGGGGGAIYINCSGSINSLTLSAKGGNGGNNVLKSGTANSMMAYGPGGGGGGGQIRTTPAVITTSVTGGLNGIVQYTPGAGTEICQIDNLFPPNGATIGGSGNTTSTLSAIPTITAIAGVTICAGNSATLTGGVTGTSTIAWYSATAGGTLLGTGSPFTSTALAAGTHTIYAGFCPGGIYRVPVIITVSGSPTLSVPNTTICNGFSGTLTASGANTYSWSTGAATASISANPTTTAIYTVTGTNIALCSSSTTATIFVNNSPTVSVNSASVCSGTSAVLTASGAASYSWNTGAGTASIAASPTITTIYTVTGTSFSCTANVTATINVVTQPTVTVNSPAVCFGNSVVITATGAATYSWNTGASTASISVSPTVTTIYTVTGTNGGTCTNVNSSTVSISPQPSLSLNANLFNICGAQTASIIASANGTYSWSNGATTNSITTPIAGVYNVTVTNSCGSVSQSATVTTGAAPAFTISSSSPSVCTGKFVNLTTAGSTGTFVWSDFSNAPNISVNAPGIYTATLTNACGTATASINIGSIANLSLNITSSGSFCIGQTVTLTANSLGTATSIVWSDGTTGPILTTSITGLYIITGSNPCGILTSSYNVLFQSAPNVSLTTSASSICPGQTATLTANGINGGNYFWSSSPTNTSNVETVSSSGNYIVTYSNACSSASAAIAITQSTLIPDFNFTPNGGPTPLTITFNNTSTNNISNQWTFGNGLNSNNINDNSLYTIPGIYTISLVIQNSDGCSATVSKTLEVVQAGLGIIPEILTPNNDGKNDFFEIKGIDNYPNNELFIYNRWGNLVYKLKGYNNSWNGSPNYNGKTGGDKLAPGTYYYLLNLGDTDNKVFKGFVELMY